MVRGICKDRVGERHGSVVVKERTTNDSTNNARWVCKCDCGKEVTIRAHLLKNTKYCGHKCELFTASIRRDITGQRFGRLVAVKRLGRRGIHSEWLFDCDCGNEHAVVSTHAISGYTKSCGCLGVESRLTHGRSHSRAYKSERWQAYMSAKRRATPMGEQDEAVLAIYEKARALSVATGAPHEVDHIIPLQGTMVSGLHVVANLQVLTRSQNRKKSRSFHA